MRHAPTLLIAIGVDEDLNQVLDPQRVKLAYLEKWISRTLRKEDAIVLEMTTNTWQLYEDLLPHVGSVTVVHPPHVALITRAQVMTDKIAASILARLHAKGLLVGIWVPPKEVQELRSLVAHRNKMTGWQPKPRIVCTPSCTAATSNRPKAICFTRITAAGGWDWNSARPSKPACYVTWMHLILPNSRSSASKLHSRRWLLKMNASLCSCSCRASA